MKENLSSTLEQYLEEIDYDSPIDLGTNEELIYKICAHTGLNFDSSKIILENILQVIRNQLMKRNKVLLNNCGELYVIKNNIVYFKLSKSLQNKIRGYKLDLTKIIASELIAYIAAYRVFKTNKNLAINCMEELDKRRQSGYIVDYETEIENQAAILSSIGKGYIVKLYNSSQSDKIIQQIRDLGFSCMIFDQDQGLIHIGILDENSRAKIANLTGVQEILNDRKIINAFSSKLS